MPTLTIEVGPDDRHDLLRELLRIYALKADAVHHAAEAYVADERSPTVLLGHREELSSVGALIEQLGWRMDAPAGPARLAGEERILVEAGHGALDRAISELSESLSAPSSGRGDLETIGRCIARINGLFALLLSLYRLAAAPV